MPDVMAEHQSWLSGGGSSWVTRSLRPSTSSIMITRGLGCYFGTE
jgi:hypothetical protein